MTATDTDLNALLERVKAATGPDRELDYAIERMSLGDIGYIIDHWTEEQKNGLISLYTGSIDAALALTERVLPGWSIAHLSQQDDKSWFCELREGYLTSYNRVAMSETALGKRPANLPLAIIAATLSALISRARP